MHHDLHEETLVGLADLDPECYGDDHARWLVAHDRYSEAVNLLKGLISVRGCDALHLPLGNIVAEHGEMNETITSYAAGTAHGDYYSADNLSLLRDRPGQICQARHLIRLAASHGDRSAVACGTAEK